LQLARLTRSFASSTTCNGALVVVISFFTIFLLELQNPRKCRGLVANPGETVGEKCMKGYHRLFLCLIRHIRVASLSPLTFRFETSWWKPPAF
jgi:hypothetical protein